MLRYYCLVALFLRVASGFHGENAGAINRSRQNLQRGYHGLGMLTKSPITMTSSKNTRLYMVASKGKETKGKVSKGKVSKGKASDEATIFNGEDFDRADAVVCGGGPAGLLTAIMLAQLTLPMGNRRFPSILVYDRLSAAPNPDDESVWRDVANFYLIGLGRRAQSALRRFGLWETVARRCVTVVGRKDWTPGQDEPVEQIFGSERSVQTQIMPRDKLVGVLCKHIEQFHDDQITLRYSTKVLSVDFEYGDGVLLRVAKCSDQKVARMSPSSAKTASEFPERMELLCEAFPKFVTTPFLVAADGTFRTIANSIQGLDQDRLAKMNPVKRFLVARKAFSVKRYIDDNQRIYKTIPLKLPSDWRRDINYSVRNGRVNFDALPANNRGDYCGVLLLKKGDPLAKGMTKPADLRELFDELLPQFSILLDDATIADAAKKPVSYLPSFKYAGPRLHEGDYTVLLGDCVHTLKPYFGLGANSALEDVKVLGDVLRDNPDTAKAIRKFSKLRAPEAKTLVRLSRELDRPGIYGFVVFILPIILDAVFVKLSPLLFMPNVITMLQRDDYTFRQVAKRKRFDRIMQILFIGAVLAGVGMAAKFVVTTVFQVVTNQGVVRASRAGVVAVYSLLQKAFSLLQRGSATAFSPLQKMLAK
jgi:kynurenine 3-monooxygenase